MADKFLSTLIVFSGALLGFCIGGFAMCISYGGTMTQDARPAPLWTLAIPSGLALIGGFCMWLFVIKDAD